MDKKEVLKILHENRERLARFQVRSLSVLGSVVRGEAKPGSDIDILIEFEPGAPVGLFEFIRLKCELSVTRSLAAEFAPQIRLNAIAPSLVDTPLAENLLSTEGKRHAAGERHPLKRIGRPQDIARMAVFLLSDAADMVTGQFLHIDGGMSTLRIFK